MGFMGEDTEVDISGHDGQVEFDAWRWAELDEALSSVIEFKRDVYRQVIEAFRPLADQMRAGAA